MTRRRVLVLGGGCGGVAAAWALTRTPELRARHEVTLVQPGWRLGGKGATGRCAERHQAVLEHGLHLWLGFYRSAFGMVRDLYEAWDGPSMGPQRSIEAAFSPLFEVGLRGEWEGTTQTWRMRFPRRGGAPWTDDSWRAVPGAITTFVADLPRMLVSTPDEPWSRHRLACLVRLTRVVIAGLAREVARDGTTMWERMDELDLREWLRRHGATAAEASSPPISALYDLGFAYPDGHAGSDRGAIAAGSGLRVLLKIFGAYRGAPFYRMNAGMGDTVFAPAWDVLRARGVRFRLFHRAEELRAADGAVTSVRLGAQARGWEDYQPLVEVGPIRAWPDRPRREQLAALVDGDLEADEGDVLENVELRRGRDFDDVVLAIPPGAHPRIAASLIEASPRFRRMVEHAHAVPTIAAQWWFARGTGVLDTQPAVLTGLSGMFRTWANLSEVTHAEAWPERPAGLAYLCSAAPPELLDTTDRDRATRTLADAMRAWANGPFLELCPAARGPDGRFDPSLFARSATRTGWDAPYVRANVARWERYVLSVPGTMHHRLSPGDSSFSNLLLAGDWTRNIINGGSVEGAVSSGIAAAAAIAAR